MTFVEVTCEIFNYSSGNTKGVFGLKSEFEKVD